MILAASFPPLSIVAPLVHWLGVTNTHHWWVLFTVMHTIDAANFAISQPTLTAWDWRILRDVSDFFRSLMLLHRRFAMQVFFIEDKPSPST